MVKFDINLYERLGKTLVLNNTFGIVSMHGQKRTLGKKENKNKKRGKNHIYHINSLNNSIT